MLKLRKKLAQSARAYASALDEAVPPSLSEIAERLKPLCERRGITRLDVFGSVARGDSRPGSDVDLIANFQKVPGLAFSDVEAEMEQVLGVRVDLLTRELAEDLMTNPFIRPGMARDRVTIYGA